MRLLAYIEFFFIYLTCTFGCHYKYHYWRPFFGEHFEHDFIAGRDFTNQRVFVGKVIPTTERRSWTFSTQLKYDYVEFAYEDTKIRRIDRFMEILSVEPQYQYRFSWFNIPGDWDLNQLEHRCCMCLVEGGIFRFGGRVITSYIGRVINNGSVYIGTVFIDSWAMERGIHFVRDGIARHRFRMFQVLVYSP